MGGKQDVFDGRCHALEPGIRPEPLYVLVRVAHLREEPVRRHVVGLHEHRDHHRGLLEEGVVVRLVRGKPLRLFLVLGMGDHAVHLLPHRLGHPGQHGPVPDDEEAPGLGIVRRRREPSRVEDLPDILVRDRLVLEPADARPSLDRVKEVHDRAPHPSAIQNDILYRDIVASSQQRLLERNGERRAGTAEH